MKTGLTADKLLREVYIALHKKYASRKIDFTKSTWAVPVVNEWDFEVSTPRAMEYASVQFVTLPTGKIWLFALGQERPRESGERTAHEFSAWDIIAVSLPEATFATLRAHFFEMFTRILCRAEFFQLSLIMTVERNGKLAFHKNSMYAPSLMEILDLPNFAPYENRWRDIPETLIYPDFESYRIPDDPSREPRYRPVLADCITQAIVRVLETYDADSDLKKQEKRNPEVR